MATELRNLVRAVAAFLQFEQLSRRSSLFGEAYLSQPIGHFLMARYAGVKAEYPHFPLAETMEGSGRRPSVDYVVLNEWDKPSIAIEAKWLSAAPDILEQLIRDLVRLELLVKTYGCKGYLVLAGRKRRAKSIFEKAAFRPKPKQPKSRILLPLNSGDRSSLRLESPSAFRRTLIRRALRSFDGQVIAANIPLISAGCSPDDAALNQYCVYGWRIEARKVNRFTYKGREESSA